MSRTHPKHPSPVEEVRVVIPQGAMVAGKYRVNDLLAVGGMGLVFAGVHVELDQRVAIKVVRPELSHNEEAVTRFLNEARAAARLRGQHVARVLDSGRLESGIPYLVMEFLDGADLGTVLRRSGPLPVSAAVHYLLQACEAIAEAHAEGIVHRDLKPENLFLIRAPDGSPVRQGARFRYFQATICRRQKHDRSNSRDRFTKLHVAGTNGSAGNGGSSFGRLVARRGSVRAFGRSSPVPGANATRDLRQSAAGATGAADRSAPGRARRHRTRRHALLEQAARRTLLQRGRTRSRAVGLCAGCGALARRTGRAHSAKERPGQRNDTVAVGSSAAIPERSPVEPAPGQSGTQAEANHVVASFPGRSGGRSGRRLAVVNLGSDGQEGTRARIAGQSTV